MAANVFAGFDQYYYPGPTVLLAAAPWATAANLRRFYRVVGRSSYQSYAPGQLSAIDELVEGFYLIEAAQDFEIPGLGFPTGGSVPTGSIAFGTPVLSTFQAGERFSITVPLVRSGNTTAATVQLLSPSGVNLLLDTIQGNNSADNNQSVTLSGLVPLDAAVGNVQLVLKGLSDVSIVPLTFTAPILAPAPPEETFLLAAGGFQQIPNGATNGNISCWLFNQSNSARVIDISLVLPPEFAGVTVFNGNDIQLFGAVDASAGPSLLLTNIPSSVYGSTYFVTIQALADNGVYRETFITLGMF